jgi:hypothetical protein
MPQPCNGLAPEERADILRVRPQGALCKAQQLIADPLGFWGLQLYETLFELDPVLKPMFKNTSLNLSLFVGDQSDQNT